MIGLHILQSRMIDFCMSDMETWLLYGALNNYNSCIIIIAISVITTNLVIIVFHHDTNKNNGSQ